MFGFLQKIKMKTILVTGGLGYIGSHTVVELLNSDYNVIIADDLSNSQAFIYNNICKMTGKSPVFYLCDLKKGELVKNIFDEQKIDAVIHFAAYKAAGESQEKPLDYYENNTVSLLNVLKEMRDRNIKTFIFSSSCTVYGQASQMPIDEDAPIKNAESSYGRTKQMGESIVQDFAVAHSGKVALLRYFNPIGAHPSGILGELPKGEPNNLVPYVVQTAAGIREKLRVFGNNYPTSDGSAVRDYIYVVDLAKAHIAALNKLLNSEAEKAIDIFNLGTGKGSSVLEVITAFEKATGIKIPYQIYERRPGDITMAYASTDKAQRELKWVAKADLEYALQTAWRWQEYLNEHKLV